MSNVRLIACLALAVPLLSGCALFGSSETDKKLESDLSNLMLDQQILETRLSLTEDRVISLQTQINEFHGGTQNGAKKPAPKAAASKPATSTAAPKASAPKATASKPASQAKPAAAVAPQFTPAKASGEALYKNALDAFMARKYKQSEGLFVEFTQKYPKSSLMPNAGYWLGECYYAQKRYDEAILSFQGVVSSYPRHQKASDSLLKTGYSYDQIGDKANARFYLEQVIELYPTADAAKKARNLLAIIG